jgi:5-(carboxyamino)imidazole ribonucleotide mutase
VYHLPGRESWEHSVSQPYVTVRGARVGILLGSASDWPVMKVAAEVLEQFGVAHEANALSAHRNPELVAEYCRGAALRGLQVLICAAGGAAHLAGVAAAHTHLPVLGCPMPAWSLDGLDSLLSTVQMPRGVPVGTFAIGKAGAANAALFAVSILSLSDATLREKLAQFRATQSSTVQKLD